MSMKLMTAVYDSNLNKSLKAVAVALADHASDDGTSIFPSVAYTAWKTGYSDRAVQLAIKRLVQLRILVQDGYMAGGVKRYRMIVTNLPHRPSFEESMKAKREAANGGELEGGENFSPPDLEIVAGGEISSPQGVKFLHPGGEIPAPIIISNNHHIESSKESVTTLSAPNEFNVFISGNSQKDKSNAKPRYTNEVGGDSGEERPHAKLMRLYQEALGYKIPNGAKEGTAAKKILSAGFCPEDVATCYRWMKQNPFWQDKHLSLIKVYEQLAVWIQNGRPTTFRNPNGRTPHPDGPDPMAGRGIEGMQALKPIEPGSMFY